MTSIGVRVMAMLAGKTIKEREQLLLVAHRFICSLLDLRREKGFWITGGKTWDCIKWNYGDVAISRRAGGRYT
jgi:hypothetical protein